MNALGTEDLYFLAEELKKRQLSATFRCHACGCLQDAPRHTLVPVGPVLLPLGWILNLCPAHGPETICFECAEEFR